MGLIHFSGFFPRNLCQTIPKTQSGPRAPGAPLVKTLAKISDSRAEPRSSAGAVHSIEVLVCAETSVPELTVQAIFHLIKLTTAFCSPDHKHHPTQRAQSSHSGGFPAVAGLPQSADLTYQTMLAFCLVLIWKSAEYQARVFSAAT